MSKYPNDDQGTKMMRITEWLSRDEMIKHQQLQQRCRGLNNSATPSKNGKKQYFIRGEHIYDRVTKWYSANSQN